MPPPPFPHHSLWPDIRPGYFLKSQHESDSYFLPCIYHLPFSLLLMPCKLRFRLCNRTNTAQLASMKRMFPNDTFTCICFCKLICNTHISCPWFAELFPLLTNFLVVLCPPPHLY